MPDAEAPILKSVPPEPIFGVMPAPSLLDFPTSVTQPLAHALADYLRSRSEEHRVVARAALNDLSRHTRGLDTGAQRMLRAIKGVWVSLPEVAELDPEEGAAMFERLMGSSLDAYYENEPEAVAPR